MHQQAQRHVARYAEQMSAVNMSLTEAQLGPSRPIQPGDSEFGPPPGAAGAGRMSRPEPASDLTWPQGVRWLIADVVFFSNG